MQVSKVRVSFSLLELVDLLDPLGIPALRSRLDEALYKVFDIAADTEIDRYVLAYLGAVTIDVDLRGRQRGCCR